MTFQPTILFVLLTAISGAFGNQKTLAQKQSKLTLPSAEGKFNLDPTFTKESKPNFDESKGQLFWDSKNCQYKILRENTLVSVVEGNFKIEFADGRTVFGNIKGANKNRPGCFYTLSETKRSDSDEVIISHIGSYGKTSENCKTLHSDDEEVASKAFGENIVNEVQYRFKKQTEKSNISITIQRGVGISYKKDSKLLGSNLRTSDLEPSAKLQEECESKKEKAGPSGAKPTLKEQVGK